MVDTGMPDPERDQPHPNTEKGHATDLVQGPAPATDHLETIDGTSLLAGDIGTKVLSKVSTKTEIIIF